MANKMLIDATHPEETRVVVVRGSRVEEFDYESAARKQLRGNIYLARVTRVEPSLQAAFIDYGGNRHGFLAFNEIHPDYYQIPVADRQAIKEEEAREVAEQRESEARQEEMQAKRQQSRSNGRRRGVRRRGQRTRRRAGSPRTSELVEYISESEGLKYMAAARSGARPEDEAVAEEMVMDETGDEAVNEAEAGKALLEIIHENGEVELAASLENDAAGPEEDEANEEEGEEGDEDHPQPDILGAEDALEEVPERPTARQRRRKRYKIQEVIKRGQIMLIQVVKEERGNKGAALTTYLSLAGRYTVLMPNTARGGGISRKITNLKDRKRLREIAEAMPVPEDAGLIVRTAGANRTRAEIKRDFDYLLRLWENIRTSTLASTAPQLIYEEGNLIKRSIRDLYSREIDEVIVAGERAYREAKDFMRLIMPSHAKNVHHYKNPEPLFQKHPVERQLNAMFKPEVKLKSGGYIVINQTEALVAVDVNSGKSTKEFSIEETALKTNLEAAEETARQLRLRDLAGLIVIDFIDMDERKNNRAVEQMLKNSLKDDRARIQVGHISPFGLLEMSRQRLRTGVLEGSTTQCPHCMGTGIIRSTESIALYVLRSVEDTIASMRKKSNLRILTNNEAALYILNYKRPYLRKIESHYGIAIMVEGDNSIHGANFKIEKGVAGPCLEPGSDGDDAMVSLELAYQEIDEEAAALKGGEKDGKGEKSEKDEDFRRKRSRRSRRRKPAESDEKGAEASSSQDDQDSGQELSDEQAAASLEAASSPEDEKGSSRSRSRRRGGRRRSNAAQNDPEQKAEAAKSKGSGEGSQAENESAAAGQPANDQEAAPARPDEAKAGDGAASGVKSETASSDEQAGSAEKDRPRPARGRRRRQANKKKPDEEKAADEAMADKTASDKAAAEMGTVAGGKPDNEKPQIPANDASPDESPEKEEKTPRRRGWWQRKIM